MEVLKTDRLIIKTFAKNDFRNFLSLNQDSELMRYFDDGVKPIDKLRERFNEIVAHQEKNGFSYYNLFLKDTEEYIGQAGCYYNFDMTTNVCYGLLKKFHKQGYMTEALVGILKYSFDKFHFKDVFIRSAVENKDSIRVAEKLGGVLFKKTTNIKGVDIVYYKIEREKFNKTFNI
ncbi:MAG: GNAT family N-acetyltransferase [Rickettsiales bacterium]|jgi:ribosomal-protein-alanine N-acetyltransferase|nr:GNAT family N-acetyltransferase [Rickettsiales bacterium]